MGCGSSVVAPRVLVREESVDEVYNSRSKHKHVVWEDTQTKNTTRENKQSKDNRDTKDNTGNDENNITDEQETTLLHSSKSLESIQEDEREDAVEEKRNGVTEKAPTSMLPAIKSALPKSHKCMSSPHMPLIHNTLDYKLPFLSYQ